MFDIPDKRKIFQMWAPLKCLQFCRFGARPHADETLLRLIDRSNNQELLLYFTKSKLIVVGKQFVVGILIFGLGMRTREDMNF